MNRVRSEIKILSRLYKVFLPVFLIITLLNVAVQVVDLYIQRIFGHVIDALLTFKTFVPVLRLAGLMLAIGLLALVLRQIVQIYGIRKLDFKLPVHFGMSSWRNLFRLSIGQHHANNSGLTSSVMSRGLQSAEALAQRFAYEFLYVAMRLVVVTGAVCIFYPVCGVVLALGISAYFATTWYVNARFRPLFDRVQHAAVQRDKLQLEISRNLGLVQINAQEPRVFDEIYHAFNRHASIGEQTQTYYLTWSFLPGLMPALTKITVITAGAFMIQRGKMTSGALVTCMLWAFDAIGHVQWMTFLNSSVMERLAALKDYSHLLDSASQAEHPVLRTGPEGFAGDIEFRNVSFRYPGLAGDRGYNSSSECPDGSERKWALRNLNLSINPGEHIAIVGPSGAGKSTLVKLLLRAYDPDEGQILIGGVDIKAVDVRQLRRATGLVEQNIGLLDRTLRENILFGLDPPETCSDEWLAEVLRISRAESIVDALPAGLGTLIGENGVTLSGGERQRIGIARALAKNPYILIFDEATSQLDGENEALVRDAVSECCQSRTVLSIVHDCRALASADRIIVIQGGSIAAEGSHKELLACSDWYRKTYDLGEALFNLACATKDRSQDLRSRNECLSSPP
jgi:ABC-type multidrug transport system fused ATPase/permease subunit